MALRCMDKDNSIGIYNLKDPNQAWLLEFKTIFGDDLHGWAMQFLHPWHWTMDGKYLYLNVTPCCWDTPCTIYTSGEALIRLDLMTGKVIQTLQMDEQGRFYDFSISEDDTHLAYLRTWLDHPILNWVNLVNGDEQHIPLGDQYNQAGDLLWSPDNKKVIFTAFQGDGCENTTYFLILLDLANNDQTVFLENTVATYYPSQWIDTNHILVSGGIENIYFVVDISTRKTTPYLTPTPTSNK